MYLHLIKKWYVLNSEFWILLYVDLGIFLCPRSWVLTIFMWWFCIRSCPLCECWNIGMWFTIASHISSQSIVSQCTSYEDLFDHVDIPVVLNSVCLTMCIPWFRSLFDYSLVLYEKVAFECRLCIKWLQDNWSKVCLNKW